MDYYGLTHWGRVMHICVRKLTIIVSDNGMLHGWHQAIIWPNAGILLIGPLGTNFSEILIHIDIFSFKKMYLKMSSENWWPFCLSLNMLTSMKVFQDNSSAMAAMNIILLHMSVYFEYHIINDDMYIYVS